MSPAVVERAGLVVVSLNQSCLDVLEKALKSKLRLH